MSEKILFVDLDGTLLDTSARWGQCLQEVGAKDISELSGQRRRQFWECYQSPKYMNLDKPNENVVNFVRKAKENGYFVAILTGRSEETQKEATIQQLQQYGIPYDGIYMRKTNDYRKDYEFKAEVINKLLGNSENRNKAIVVDDSEEVRKRSPVAAYPPHNLPSLDD